MTKLSDRQLRAMIDTDVPAKNEEELAVLSHEEFIAYAEARFAASDRAHAVACARYECACHPNFKRRLVDGGAIANTCTCGRCRCQCGGYGGAHCRCSCGCIGVRQGHTNQYRVLHGDSR